MKNAKKYALICMSIMAACQPSQYLVYISTDAPIPQFGNRLHVEVVADDGQLACAACQREIGIGSRTEWPISFGIALTSQGSQRGSLHVRARLYREEHIQANPAYEAVYIDNIGKLPPLDDLVQVQMSLSLYCYGMGMQRQDGKIVVCDPKTAAYVDEPSLAPLSSDADLDSLPKPGSWLPAQPRPCTEEIRQQLPPEMACIPGGMFLLGSNLPTAATISIYTIPEVPVRVSRFAIDVDEFRVKDMHRIAPELISSRRDPTCHYSSSSADATSELPMNCITYAEAEAVCNKQGKRLPREAEWEYVAGNLTEETTYPWGEGDECMHAIISRGRTRYESASGSFEEYTDCRILPDGSIVHFGPVSGGHPGDITLTTGVRNLGGNLTEWVRDRFEFLSEGCWVPQGQTWLENPECDTSFLMRARSIRGGYWGDSRSRASAIFRQWELPEYPMTWVGFRCVKELP